MISGRNAQRVIHSALATAGGELRDFVQPRSRTAEVVTTVGALGQVRPAVPKVLVWVNARPRHPKRVTAAAQVAGVELTFLPSHSPELMPLGEVRRGMKAIVAANRGYATVDGAADRFVTWRTDQRGEDRLRRAGLRSSKFDWLPT